jgi:hypothetical protein
MTATWQLQQDDLLCHIAWLDGRLHWQLSHPHAPGGRTQLTPLPDITLEGRPAAWAALVAAEETQGPDGAPVLLVTLEDAGGELRLSRQFELHAGYPFVRTWGEVARRKQPAPSKAKVPGVLRDDTGPLIDGAAIFRLELDAAAIGVEAAAAIAAAGPAPNALAAATLLQVEQFSWPYHKDFFTPRQVPLTPHLTPYEFRMGSFPAHYHAPTSCAWIALRAGLPDPNPETPGAGNGLVVGIEFNGKSRLHAWATPAVVTLESRIDSLAHRLQPDAPFELPACFVGFYTGDWDEAGFRTQRYAEAYVHPPMPDARYPWVQYNSWRYGQEIDEAQQLAIVERCAELGIEVAVLDLGWARTIGDWRPDPAKFPRGLRPIADRAHELGMKFGVHIAICQLAPDAPAAVAHPDWYAFTGDDYYGAGAICLGHEPCRQWLIDSLVRLIEEEHLDYIIQDGEDVIKRCMRDDHSHSPGDSNYANSTQGLDQVIMAVRRAHPHLVWENCEDGGCMMTYRMGRLCHTSITVDNIATYATRQGVYGASYPFSARYSVRYMQDDPTPYTLRSSIFGGPLILMQRIGEWTPQEVADAQAAIGEYKRLRTIFRDGKIIHLLPPASNVEGLGRGWDAIQAVSLDQARSAVMVYRAVAGQPTRTIRPRGLAPGARYRVRYADAGRSEVYSAEELAHTGLHVALPELSSEIIELDIVN